MRQQLPSGFIHPEKNQLLVALVGTYGLHLACGAPDTRLRIVILGNVIVGMIAGFLGLFWALILGASPLLSILVYATISSVTIVISVFVGLAIRHVTSADLHDENAPFVRDADTLSGMAPHSKPLSAKAVNDDPSMRILAVDDDDFIQELIPKIAATVGCPEVKTASSGKQALEMISQSEVPFDCLLLDINMPEMDGIELCARIRGLEGYEEIPIIMLTAVTEFDALERAFRAGASDYTSKPFDIKDFGYRLQIAQAQTTAKRSGHRSPKVIDHATLGRDQMADQLAPIPGVSALIGSAALQNYLMGLKRADLARAYVMAIFAEQSAGITAETQTPTPLEVLPRIAVAIDSVHKNQSYVMSFVGHGRFLVIVNSDHAPSATTIEAAIQDRLNAQRHDSGRLSTPKIVISVGMAVQPNVSKSGRAQVAFANALRLAKDRADIKKVPPGIGEIRLVGQ